MLKVMYPITWLAGREGEAADVIHDIAEEMMEHRADLLRNASGAPESERQAYRKQAHLMEEYATVMNAIYYQLEPERWDPETAENVLELAQVHNIALPDWMLTNQKKPVNRWTNEPVEETTEYAENRYENEGGRVPANKLESF